MKELLGPCSDKDMDEKKKEMMGDFTACEKGNYFNSGCDEYNIKENEIRIVHSQKELFSETFYNSDIEEEEEERVNRKIIDNMTEFFEPFYIHDGRQFISSAVEDKYKNIISKELARYDCQWNEVLSVRKKEERRWKCVCI